jgi:DNA-binding response OmpR family regulator
VSKLSILVAGSDADLRALILYVLTREGFEVIGVEDESALFDRVVELHPDVALVDLPWPPDSRLALIRRLKMTGGSLQRL